MLQLTPESIVVLLGIVLALWYLIAAIYNRRRGVAIYRWLQAALNGFGGEVSGRWIGSSGSGAELVVRKATTPFKEIHLIYLLASRELLPLFLVDLLRNKRDRLIVKATLRSSLPAEIEVYPAQSLSARKLRSRQELTVEDGPHQLLIGVQGHDASKVKSALTPFLERYGSRLVSLSWSKKAPHLVLILTLDGLWAAGQSAASLYDDLTALGESASRTG